MPRDIQSIPVTFANTGIVLKSSADEIPLTAYMSLVNVSTDRENSLSVRKGFTRLNDGLPSTPYSAYSVRDIAGRTWRYAVASGRMYVAPVENPGDNAVWPTTYDTSFGVVVGSNGMSLAYDRRPIWANYTLIGSEYKPYIFVADGTAFLKHKPGDGISEGARRVGIPRPFPLESVELDANTIDVIEDFENVGLWTDDNSTLSAETGYDGISNAMGIALPAADAQVGGAYKAMTVLGGYPSIVDLDPSDPDEALEFWIKFEDTEAANNCEEMVISFGLSTTIGDVTFSTRYEKPVKPSEFEQASQVGSTGRSATYDSSIPNAIIDLAAKNAQAAYEKMTTGGSFFANMFSDEQKQEARRRIASLQGWLDDPANYQNSLDQFSTGQASIMGPGAGTWNRIRIQKREFVRVGESILTHPELDWNAVSAIRIDVKSKDTCVGGKTCKVVFDDFSIQDGRLYGIDYKYVITYYNSKTGTESDYSDPVNAANPVEAGKYVLTFPPCPYTTPPAADPDKIRIYRQGGTSQYYRKLSEDIDYVSGAIPAPYTDNCRDSLLGDVLNADNQLPPDGVKGCIIWDDRLWVWGGSYTTDAGVVVPEPPNQIRFSKAVQVESFPSQTNYLYVGSGSEQIQNCIVHDGELFVFTLVNVFRIVGSSGVYRAVSTSVNQGLRSPHGLAKGLRAVYMYSYDGIYEFPSGRKISEVINPLFFGDQVNQIPPIYAGRESDVAMGYWDNKLYFSYPTTPTTETMWNTATLVFDAIYERWHWYMYGAQSFYTEPELNILVGSNLSQWDMIQDGDFSGQHFSGQWTMRLENGFADQLAPPDNFRGIFWCVDTKDYDLGMPDQEKRFIDFVVDGDTQGVAIDLQAAWDMARPDQQQLYGEYETLGQVQTIGRQRTIVPVELGNGESKLATRCALRIQSYTESTATGFTRLFKIIHRILPEPIRHRTYVTDWSNYGVEGPKFFRELWIELDNFNQPLDRIEVQVDQAVGTILTSIPPVTAQTKLYFGLPVDLRGTLARLKIVPMGENEVKVYDHSIKVMEEPPQIDTIQTPWTHVDWPYPKLWKEILLDIDTAGIPMNFSFWLDGKVKENFSVTTTNGRERVTYSLEKDTFGKLGRVTLNEAYYDPLCCLPQGVRFYGVDYVIDKEPADVKFSDSYDYLWSFPRLKVLRRFWIAMKNPDSDVTMEVYADESLKTTKTISLQSLSTGFSKRRIDLESAIKGRLFRVIFTSTFPFQLYWERSEWELKDLNTEDGYRREQMVPPQTF